MPVHLCLELSRFQGKRIDTVAQSSIQDLGVPQGQGQQKIGIADHSASSKIVLAAQNNRPAETEPTQFYVDQTRAVPARGN
jgi:hypothetical protein